MQIKDSQIKNSGPLHEIKVLDLSQRYGYYCGKLYADMGADVILVEMPGSGSALRMRAPFIEDNRDREYSIPFFYANSSKRGITLDWTKPAGRDLLLKLAAQADLVIEDGAPGAMEAAGIGYATLAAQQPKLVLVSITPFGKSGHFAHYAADDLTLLALGGLLNLMGYPGIAPTQAYGEQAYAMGNMFAAVGSMLAIYGAGASGRGQYVDVSMQECVVMALENTAQFYDLEQKVRERYAGIQRHAGTGVFECADGFIYVFAGGMAAQRFWPNMVKWMQDERVAGADVLSAPEWSDISYVNSDIGKDVFAGIFTDFAKTKTKQELYDFGQARRVPLCPISTPADIAHNKQLAYRSFFTTIKHAPSGRDIVMPGAHCKLERTPWSIARAAPMLGQHNRAVYEELGVSAQDLAALAQAKVI